MSELPTPVTCEDQPMQTSTHEPLDVCGICPERIDDCPMLGQCEQTRGLTLDIIELKIRERMKPGASDGYRMGVAMAINDVCDMRGPRTMENIIARIGEQTDG